MSKKIPGAWKFVWTNLSCEIESNHRISRSCHWLEWFWWHFNKINYQSNLQWMLHHLRYHTSNWKLKMKSTALWENNQILLFFASFCQFFCVLDCDSCSTSCTWTTNVFFCFTEDYWSNICLCCKPHLRVFQVESIWFYTFVKVAEFITVCVDVLVFFLFVAIEIIDVTTPHNVVMEFFFNKATCINWNKWLSKCN